jgi:hypothetical protein
MLRTIPFREVFATMTVAILATSVALAMGPPAGKGPNKAWAAPACAEVDGLPSASFTLDDGASWATNPVALPLGQITTGIAALEAPNAMLAEYGGQIYRSQDAGCSWKAYGASPVSVLRIVPGAGLEAYAFGFFPGPDVLYLNAKASPRRRIEQRIGLPGDVVQLAVDPADGNRLRAMVRGGQIYESRDGATTKWGMVGTAAPVGFATYFAAFDPADLDHVVVGTVTDGVWATFDGGTTWQQATGLSTCAPPECTPRVNAFSGVVSPADPSVVWVMALDLNEADAGAPNRGRHVYRSDDGGRSFRPVVDDGGDVVLINGPVLAAHPTDRDLLYFPWGSRSQIGGVRLYRYDDLSGQTTWNLSPEWFEIRALTFHPTDPAVLYGGFEGE